LLLLMEIIAKLLIRYALHSACSTPPTNPSESLHGAQARHRRRYRPFRLRRVHGLPPPSAAGIRQWIDFSLFDNDRPRCETSGRWRRSRDDRLGRQRSVSLSWAAMPATRRAATTSSCHRRFLLVPHVRVHDGRIELDCRDGGRFARDSEIVLPGRFKKFGIAGAAIWCCRTRQER
jgi:hypothetical protein